MGDERVERRLTAILASDVFGYSRLMGADEEGTLARLKAHRRELIDPKISEHRGRIVKATGDGLLIEFASAVNAMRCAVEIQQGMITRNSSIQKDLRIEFRIGVNVGDIIVDSGDIFGDGVNVAARLEGFAEPGGICVSGRVREDAQGKMEITFEDAGEQRLKNIDRPVRVYRVKATGATSGALQPGLLYPDKPSIAVLPFQNMSGDLEQEYFADGIVEDIITALSRYNSLFVIARNSSFTYKGRAVDIKQVGRELGVRYVLEGSVRKSADRIRVTGQLIDTSTGAHLWADRFDGALNDIFDLQDDITQRVVGAIAPKLEQAEIDRAMLKSTESLDGYDSYLKGLWNFHKAGEKDIQQALRLFLKAIELDSNFSSAYGMAAWCYGRRKINGWVAEESLESREAMRIAGIGLNCGSENAIALAGCGLAVGYVAEDFERGISLIDRARVLNENLAMAWHLSGWIRCLFGQPDLAIEHLNRAIRLSPLDPQRPGIQAAIAVAHFAAERFETALDTAKTAILEQPHNFIATLVATAANSTLANDIIAGILMTRLRELDPLLRVNSIKARLPFKQPELLARLEDALRKAGLPE